MAIRKPTQALTLHPFRHSSMRISATNTGDSFCLDAVHLVFVHVCVSVCTVFRSLLASGQQLQYEQRNKWPNQHKSKSIQNWRHTKKAEAKRCTASMHQLVEMSIRKISETHWLPIFGICMHAVCTLHRSTVIAIRKRHFFLHALPLARISHERNAFTFCRYCWPVFSCFFCLSLFPVPAIEKLFSNGSACNGCAWAHVCVSVLVPFQM